MKIKLLRFGNIYFIETDKIIIVEEIRKILNIDDKIQIRFAKLPETELVEYYIIDNELTKTIKD